MLSWIAPFCPDLLVLGHGFLNVWKKYKVVGLLETTFASYDPFLSMVCV